MFVNWNYNLEQNWNIHEYSSLFIFQEFQESRVTTPVLTFRPPLAKYMGSAKIVTMEYYTLIRPLISP